MLSLCNKLGVGFIFCMVSTGAGNFLSIQYEIGQPWMYFVILICLNLLSVIKDGLRPDFDLVKILLFVCALGYLFSFLNEVNSIDGLSLYIMPLLGFIVYYSLTIQSDQKINTISSYLIISLIIFCLSIFIEPFLLIRDLGLLNQGIRLSGLALNPNLAAFFIITHLVCIKLLAKKVPNSLFIISAICIVATLSRSGILCFLLILIMDFLRNYSSRKKIKIIFTITSLLLLLIIPNSTFNYGNEYIEKFDFSRINPFSQSQHIAQDSSRLDVIGVYFDGINERPIIGHGVSHGMKQEVRAHNTILNIWYEVGIFPAMAFFCFLVLLFLRSYKQKSLFNVFIIYFVFTFFLNNLIFQSIFWISMACFYIAKRRMNTERYNW